MKFLLQFQKRSSYIEACLLLLAATIIPLLSSQLVSAAPTGGQVQFREIKLSDSRIDQAGVTYDVKFNAASSYNLNGIIVDFCDSTSTPIIGDSTCNTTNLTNFTVGASPTITLVSGMTATWTAASLNSGRTLKLTKTAGSADAVISGTTVEFTINNVHNPNTSTVNTFYARVITYDSASGDIASYAPGTEGNTNAKDYGGFALSTANAISITAKVQESMTFCVSGADPTTNCGGTSVPALTIGHGPNTILDSSQPDVALAYTQLSTNAQNGAIIRMRNTATSGGLNSGANFIPPTGDTAVDLTPALSVGFGMRLTDGSGGTGTINADAPYDDPANYGMDATTANDNVLTTYGDTIAHSTAPVDNVENTLTFAARASNTTAAGIYSAIIILIATGTF
jgi:hypothetical protein